ncbi:MAG: hypothetical protein HWE10_14555 [Gammaproteobacteria bacterium]|nr:hypothetical protein [Gammaproteobacteria bacterium]
MFNKVTFQLSILVALSALLLSACTTLPKQRIIKVNSVDDIPDINTLYKDEIAQLNKGMSQGQVLTLFSNIERECYPNGTVCHFTVFDEQLLQIDKRLGDLNILTGSLISLLTLTCFISDDSCPEAIIAALNVGLASAIENRRISSETKEDGVLTLIQWINIEFVDGKVTQWAINEPLSQFKPKSYSNELPPLEESLNTPNM